MRRTAHSFFKISLLLGSTVLISAASHAQDDSQERPKHRVKIQKKAPVQMPVMQVPQRGVPVQQAPKKQLPVKRFSQPQVKRNPKDAFKRPPNSNIIGELLGTLNFQVPELGLTEEKLERMRRSSKTAPIFGSADSKENRYTVVLSAAAGIPKGRGPRIAKSREQMVARQVRDLLSGKDVNRQLLRSQFVTSGAINAVTLTSPGVSLLRRLSQDPRVLFIQQVTTDTLDGIDYSPASWGLDRIDQPNRPTDSQFEYSDKTTGHIWVIDSGIRPTHTDFTGRVIQEVNLSGDNDPNDCNKHGTHVAGTAGGTTYGVARNAQLHIVKVVSCGNGLPSNITQAGINYVYNNASGLAVANLSIGGPYNPVSNIAVANLSASGVPVIVAAGNEGVQACNRSPSSEPSAITVAASDHLDRHAYFSNYSTCIDLHAPGTAIVSASHLSDTGAITLQGTSMAAPHVAGIAAAILMDNPSYTAQQVHDAVKAEATSGVMTWLPPNTPNRLAYYKPQAPQPNLAPTALASINWSYMFSGRPGIELDARQSTDPENQTLTYDWTETSGNVAVQDVDFQTFTAPIVSTTTQLNFDLVVTDSLGLSSTAQMHIGAVVTPDVCTPFDLTKLRNEIPVSTGGVNSVARVTLNKTKVRATLNNWLATAQGLNAQVDGAELFVSLMDMGTSNLPSAMPVPIANLPQHIARLQQGAFTLHNTSGPVTDFFDGSPVQLDHWYQIQTKLLPIHIGGGMNDTCAKKTMTFRLPRMLNSPRFGTRRSIEIFDPTTGVVTNSSIPTYLTRHSATGRIKSPAMIVQ